MFQKLSRKGNGSTKDHVASHTQTSQTFVPLPSPLVNILSDEPSSVHKASPALDNRPTERRLSWASNLFKPTRSKPLASKVKIGPSGAIVFEPCESQESLASTLVTASGTPERAEAALVPTTKPTLVVDHHNPAGSLRSSSPASTNSVPATLARRRSSENYQPRLSNFLGRHPPPIQRRSTSLPPTPLSRIPERLLSPNSERELLFIGGHSLPSSAHLAKVPRFVPLAIRRTNARMAICAADCPCSVEKEGDFCPEHEDQFSTIGTRGSTMYSSLGYGEFGRCHPPNTAGPSEKKSGSGLGFMAKFRGILGGKGKNEAEGVTYNERKTQNQADNPGATKGN